MLDSNPDRPAFPGAWKYVKDSTRSTKSAADQLAKQLNKKELGR